MKITFIYNNYRSGGGGETAVVEQTISLLRERGHETRLVSRNSQSICSLWQKVRAAFKGMYSWEAKGYFRKLLSQDKPDIVHAHNLYPLFSPSVLCACRELGIPTVMTIHNYGLICPIGVGYRDKSACSRCSGGREYWCVLQNCKNSICESTAYAIRSAVARTGRLFANNVTVFIAVSDFVKQRLRSAGIPLHRISVVRNMVVHVGARERREGDYVAFAGRLSQEKGLATLLAAASATGLPVRIAGEGPERERLSRMKPRNAVFVGPLNREQMKEFYRNARIVVVPSLWDEPCPLVPLEAMSHSLPVIAARTGALSEIVDDSVTGYLFEPANADDLATKLSQLWTNRECSWRMGQAGFEKVTRKYNEDVYYDGLLNAYARAIELGKRGKGCNYLDKTLWPD